MKHDMKRGLHDGIPIALAYLSVGFTFGIMASADGLSPLQAAAISLANVTSAGQFAGLSIMAAGSSLFEMALTQFIINLRYTLMSISLSQKADKSIRTIDRMLISFVVTDEVFATASSQEEINRSYMYGLILLPYLGWSGGTLLGAAAGDVLPAAVCSALGIAIYGMFIALIIPPSKHHASIAGVVAAAVALSCLFHYVPALTKVSGGFVIIICAIAASAAGAFFAPLPETQEGGGAS